jgi:hypothetical protein
MSPYTLCAKNGLN